MIDCFMDRTAARDRPAAAGGGEPVGVDEHGDGENNEAGGGGVMGEAGPQAADGVGGYAHVEGGGRAHEEGAAGQEAARDQVAVAADSGAGLGGSGGASAAGQRNRRRQRAHRVMVFTAETLCATRDTAYFVEEIFAYKPPLEIRNAARDAARRAAGVWSVSPAKSGGSDSGSDGEEE